MNDVENSSRSYWFLRGMRGIYSLPAIILMSSFVGFAGFASEAGLQAGETVFMVGIVWALPAKVLLVSAVLSGTALPAAFLTVTLSSIRLMPMVASLIPEIRTKNTPLLVLLLISHFIAITAWVFTMERIRDVPRKHRVAFFLGFALTLTVANMVLVALFFSVVDALPPLVAGSLFFLTPIYFLASIWASSRDSVGHYAMIAGLLLAPVFHLISPELDILYAGIVAGTVAFIIELAVTRAKRRQQQERA